MSKNHSIRGSGVKSFVQPLLDSLGEHEGKQLVKERIYLRNPEGASSHTALHKHKSTLSEFNSTCLHRITFLKASAEEKTHYLETPPWRRLIFRSNQEISYIISP